MWPTVLPTIALNRALVSEESKIAVNGWKISKFKFFWMFFIGSFCYFWIPGYLFSALSNFDWMVWIKPDDLLLNTITGFYGLGINPITTFDWNIISFNSPLVWPFYTQLNAYIGTAIAGCIIIPAVYYTNYKWTAYIPINTNSLYANDQTPYDVTQVLDSKGLFSDELYQKYSPPYYSAANLVVYGAFFAIYPYAVIDQTLSNWTGIKGAFIDVYKGLIDRKRSNFHNQKDGFSQCMSHYKEVPDWWFFTVLLISLVLGIIFVEIYPTNTPVWGIFFALGINFVFLIPLTLIYSSTGFSFGLNVLVELIVGYALPGNGIALMIIKTYGYNIDGQSESYLSTQKMAHYTKIPPRAIFRAMILATFIQCFVSIGVVNFLIHKVDGICNYEIQSTKEKFLCPSEKTYYSSSVIWGVIGPKLVFKSIYPILKWCFLIGALIPAPIWYAKKRFPKQLKYFHPVIVIGGFLNYAPYSLAFYTPGIFASYAFMVHIRRRYFGWWERYNYVLTSALTAGVALSAIIIFFAVQYHPKSVSWWGTEGYANNTDLGLGGAPRLTLAEGEIFGFPYGQFPTNS
ncbi:Opt2p [Sugiyamaella lignohabitans]|uniref:Opt2p n=1 Tax=Sugiyamaella lignohabitans TaxID=796027 RepID=A0A167FCT4_9ASCO|nr:Opt2p [Sugiyamaella lignohabitans]ANB15129.1 Opt2p [Sugiyamaella lignohabitans]